MAMARRGDDRRLRAFRLGRRADWLISVGERGVQMKERTASTSLIHPHAAITAKSPLRQSLRRRVRVEPDRPRVHERLNRQHARDLAARRAAWSSGTNTAVPTPPLLVAVPDCLLCSLRRSPDDTLYTSLRPKGQKAHFVTLRLASVDGLGKNDIATRVRCSTTPWARVALRSMLGRERFACPESV